MELKRMIDLLKIERECVRRNSDCECDRDCANCDLVQIDKDLLEMYDSVIETLSKGLSKEKSTPDCPQA